VAEALARLRGAEQLIRQIELEIDNTRLSVPFDGILQERPIEVGDFVGIGDPVARVIDLDPIVVEGQVTEFQVPHVKIGEIGHAELAGGRVVDGTIRYVAVEADPQSRTFRVELELPNPDYRIPAGLTAQIRVETERVFAHRISPRLISISDEGLFGIKIVDADNRVQFIEADIVRYEQDALWLGNLPRQIRLITMGEGFTQPGDLVEVADETVEWQ
jgi:multidrug efflux system membrane fusion protein